MEDLSKYILRFTPKEKKELLHDQSALNKALIKKLCAMVAKRSNGKKQFILVDEMKQTYLQIFRYLNNDESLQDESKHVSIQPWNIDKGLMLIGNFGRGKTLLLDLIYENRMHLSLTGRYCTAFEMSRYFNDDKKKFEDYTSGSSCLFLDEIGDEPKETLNYGNAENVAYRTMKLFFDKVEKQEKDKVKFFGTSNLGQSDLIERYDERIWSRIVGNCNIVVFGSEIKDFRK